MTTQQSWPTGALNRETTLEVLTQHNAWRRGAKGPQTDPRMLGLALDAAIAALSQSQSASPAAAAVPDVEMARHWIDRYASGIDHECQIDRVCEALGVPLAAAQKDGA